MRSFFRTLRFGWELLTHPNQAAEDLLKERNAAKYSWIFLLLSLVLWTFVTGYQNIVIGETSRARDIKLGLSLGPDIIVTALTIPLGIAAVTLIAFLVTRLLALLGGRALFRDVFIILSFTLNVGPTFFDLQFEIGATLTGHAWKLHDVPNFVYYAAFIMFVPLLWSLLITVLALSNYAKLSIQKTLIAFLVGILPLFSLLLFILM